MTVLMFGLCVQRLLAHRVAQYYGLETATVEGEDPDKGKIRAAKTPNTRAPKVRRLLLPAISVGPPNCKRTQP